jgi:glycosyltransferase involved in cell wall biosynthesis
MNYGHPQQPTPRLSIIISTLNAARTLARCLDSISAQLFRDFEVIIVDGGSVDDTGAISARYGPLISQFQSEPDSGIYDAWNKALEIARGDWICFIGADDWYTSPNALGKFAAAAAYPEITLVTARTAMTDSGGTVVRTYGVAWDAGRMKRYMCIAHPGAWHHRSLFNAYGSFFSGLPAPFAQRSFPTFWLRWKLVVSAPDDTGSTFGKAFCF